MSAAREVKARSARRRANEGAADTQRITRQRGCKEADMSAAREVKARSSCKEADD
jgi:hypothetical protein